MYRLFLFLSVCNAVDDYFGDYWYTNDDGNTSGVAEGGDLYGEISEQSNRQTSNKNDVIHEIPDNKTERIPSDSEKEKKEAIIKETDSNYVLEIFEKVLQRRKCDSSNKQCAMEEFETGVNILMKSLPILRIPSNLEVVADGGELIKDKINNVLGQLSDGDKDLIMMPILK